MGIQTYTGSLEPSSVQPETWAHYREMWHLAESLEILTEHPLHLDIELTSICNLKCKMCWQADLLDAPMGFMQDDLFKRVIDKGVKQGLRAVKLQIRGESTLHPRLPELARYASEAGIFDIQLTTNGTLLEQDEKIDNLLSCGLEKLIFSIDPAHDESALEIYGGRAPDVEKVIHRAFERRSALGLKKPAIRIQAVALPYQSLGAVHSDLSTKFPDADAYNVAPKWEADFEKDSVEGLANFEMMPCSYLWTRLAVFWNGDVTMCCRDYNYTVKLGNLNETTVSEIWTSPRMMEIREAHLDDRRDKIPVCGHCEMCTRPKSDLAGTIVD